MGEAKDVTFELAGGGEGRGRLALPAGSGAGTGPGAGPWPGLLVLHEILGLNADMERIALRFAAAGYAALAPDFFGPGVRPLCILRAISELRRPDAAKPAGAFDILSSAQRHLGGIEGVDANRIGAVGFCMGGGFAVLHAARAPVGVVGCFYGDVPEDAESLRGIPPVFAGFGERDRIFGPGAERLRAHLERLEVPFEIQLHPGAGHSYMSPNDGWLARLAALGPMRVGYDEEAAEQSWIRMLAFFDDHLAASS